MAVNWGVTGVNMLDLPVEFTFPNLGARDEELATMFATPPLNPIPSMMRFNRVTLRLEEWNAPLNVWEGKTLSVSGGGTGGNDPVTARAGLGIGSLGVQNSNAVNITGGNITGLNSLMLAGHISFAANGQYNIGSSTVRAGRVYIGGGLVVPVGPNKWVPAP
jgi:hypothetical protein